MNIDSARIYMCGISNGGLLTQRLACELPNIFAAGASVAASFPTDSNLVLSKPFPILYMLGTDDRLMPFQGGDMRGPLGGRIGKLLSAENSTLTWVKYNRCPIEPVVNIYGTPGANLSIESKTYGPGKDNSEVVFCVVKGGGHCWPGGEQYVTPKIVGYTSPINGNEIIWQFFNRHVLTN